MVLKSFSIDRTDSRSSFTWMPFNTAPGNDWSFLRLPSVMLLISSFCFCVMRTMCVMCPKLFRIDRSRFLANHTSGVLSWPTCSSTLSTISHDFDTYSNTFVVNANASSTSSKSSPRHAAADNATANSSRRPRRATSCMTAECRSEKRWREPQKSSCVRTRRRRAGLSEERVESPPPDRRQKPTERRRHNGTGVHTQRRLLRPHRGERGAGKEFFCRADTNVENGLRRRFVWWTRLLDIKTAREREGKKKEKDKNRYRRQRSGHKTRLPTVRRVRASVDERRTTTGLIGTAPNGHYRTGR